MAALDPSIVEAIKANGLLKLGHFAYRSGEHSGCLIDRDQLLTGKQVVVEGQLVSLQDNLMQVKSITP